MINVFQPALGAEELEAVRRVFESHWVGQGAITSQFEEAFARHCQAPAAHMRSVSCATEGLFQAMDLLGIGPGDEVILPTISFVGAANAIAHAGARPVFCDVDPATLNVTAAHIAASITPRAKAVLLLHYGGLPCDMDAICELVAHHDLSLIEDSACSVSSTYRGRACGAFGDVGVWSFDAMKILVTGDGGMVYCRQPQHTARLAKLTYLGLEQESGFQQKDRDRWWEFEISSFGRRAIINDITAAIGLEQLRKLPGFVARRRQIHERYDHDLKDLPWLRCPPAFPAHVSSSYYFYWIQTEPRHRDGLAQFLRSQGIYTTFRYYPLHRVKFYGAGVSLPAAEHAADTTLCLPIHQSLTDADLDRIVECISAFPA